MTTLRTVTRRLGYSVAAWATGAAVCVAVAIQRERLAGRVHPPPLHTPPLRLPRQRLPVPAVAGLRLRSQGRGQVAPVEPADLDPRRVPGATSTPARAAQ